MGLHLEIGVLKEAIMLKRSHGGWALMQSDWCPERNRGYEYIEERPGEDVGGGCSLGPGREAPREISPPAPGPCGPHGALVHPGEVSPLAARRARGGQSS